MRVECRGLASESQLLLAIEAAHLAGEEWASSWSPAAVLAESRSTKSFVVHSDSGEEAGCLFLRPPGALWEITLVFVAPAHRGRGVFEELFRAAKHEILRTASDGLEAVGQSTGSRQDQSRLGLEVRADNVPALKAYSRVGLREVGRRKAYYRDGCDAILMEISL